MVDLSRKTKCRKNPLSGHTSASTNAIILKEEHDLVRTVDGIQSSMRSIFVALCRVGLMKLGYNQEDTCGFHSTTQHSIEECTKFKWFLQDLINRHLIQCYRKKEEEEVFAQIREGPISPRPKPLVIHFTKSSSIPPGRQLVVIETPSPFPYKSEKAVPWKYGVNVLRG